MVCFFIFLQSYRILLYFYSWHNLILLMLPGLIIVYNYTTYMHGLTRLTKGLLRKLPKGSGYNRKPLLCIERVYIYCVNDTLAFCCLHLNRVLFWIVYYNGFVLTSFMLWWYLSWFVLHIIYFNARFPI